MSVSAGRRDTRRLTVAAPQLALLPAVLPAMLRCLWRAAQRCARPTAMLLVLLVLLVQHPGPAAAYLISDERGVAVAFEQAPSRIVSMVPSLTESVCALGQCARLVGVDRYSNWPAEVADLPKLGGLDDADVEGIVGLQPDLVLLSRSARITQRLQSLGVKVLVFEPKTHQDVQRTLQRLGEVLQIPAAQGADRLWSTIDTGVATAAASLSPSLRDTRVYFEVNRGPYAAGEASFIGQTLSRLGVKNIVPAALGPFPKLNPEFVVRADPDLIMIGDRSFDGLAQRPGWLVMRAIRDDRICRFTPAQGDVLVRAGPRLAEAAGIMAACLRDKGVRW